MERFDRRLHVRVGEADVERAQALAGASSITTSALVRLPLQLPAEDVEARRHVVLDLACANRLYRELNQWGYQQNQAAHALSRIAYHLRREAMDVAAHGQGARAFGLRQCQGEGTHALFRFYCKVTVISN